MYVLGCEGGNSKTIALVGRLDGSIVGFGRAGPADIYGAPSEEAAIDEIERAVWAAVLRGGIPLYELDCGVFCLAGADWPEDFELLTHVLTKRGLSNQVVVMNDAFGGLRAGSVDGTGVAVVCGTGAAIGALSPDGRRWHTGWWQEAQGSRQLAEKALRAVVRGAMGIAAPTSLKSRFLGMYGSTTVEECLHRFTAREAGPKPNLAAFARALLAEAQAGDATARAIVSHHSADLGTFAVAAARRVGLGGTRFRLVLAGGMFRGNGDLLRRSLCARVRTEEGLAEPVLSLYEPAVGALMLGFDMVGGAAARDVAARVSATLPPPELFAT
jgi:N-acetylglucosamine kinase-like BadF-type ATPase